VEKEREIEGRGERERDRGGERKKVDQFFSPRYEIRNIERCELWAN
jgi:hypothetical protein